MTMLKINNTQFKELFVQNKANPIIQARDIPYQPNSIFNVGVNSFNNDALLLMRVKNHRGILHLIPQGDYGAKL